MAGRSGGLRDRPWLRAWLVVGIAAWATLGVLLVGRANSLGLVDNINISPYHVVGYAALLVLGVYVLWAFFSAFRRGDWRRAFPPMYGGLGLAFLLLVAWVVLDPIWAASIGIGPGIENALAPPRPVLPAATILGLGAAIATSGALAWSVTLLLGVAIAAGAIGWALGEVVERLLSKPAAEGARAAR